MFQNIAFSMVGGLLGMVFLFSMAFAQEKTTTSTTTVETIQQTKTPAPAVKSAPVRKTTSTTRPAAKQETTAISTTTTTTEVKPPPPKEVVHTVYDEDSLEKMKDKLCSAGFKAYVGSADKNVCKTLATPPDMAYSCVWDKDGPAAFAATKQGPCNLDYTEHRGNVVIKKDQFKDDPPLSYGKEAQCCYRPAKSLESAAVVK